MTRCIVEHLQGGRFANGASTTAMQFAFNQLTQRATFQARTVAVPDGLTLTDEDNANIAGINQGLHDAGRAIYASGDAEAISNYRNAELIYDPDSLTGMDTISGDHVSAAARAGRDRITFGRGGHGSKAWSARFNGANDGSSSYNNATFHVMTGISMRAWLILHEFGHLHSNYGPLGNAAMTEFRANEFARKMIPYLRRETRLSPHVFYEINISLSNRFKNKITP